MPYVSESSQTPGGTLTMYRSGVGTFSYQAPDAVSRSQYGYRTGKRTPDEVRGSSPDLVWGTARSEIDALTGAYLGNRKSRTFAVHDRDYVDSRTTPGTSDWSVHLDGYSPVFASTFAYPDNVASLPTPSDGELAAKAAGLLRRSAPSREEIDLARSLGELKDSPMLFRASNYLPQSIRHGAGGYLNLVFGIVPTVKDIMQAAETVVSANRIVSNYLRHEHEAVRRRRSLVLDEKNVVGSGLLYNSSFNYIGGAGLSSVYPCPEFRIRGGQLVPYQRGGSSDLFTPMFDWVYTAKLWVRGFATYEYYIPQPAGLASRLSRSTRLARRLLGGGLDASTMYDLTPFSWLVDWFVDIGGLLRYQQHVADNQIVMSRCGWVMDQYITADFSISGWMYDTSRARTPYKTVLMSSGPKITGSYRHHKQRRRAGSPFSLTPDWDLSPQQWAVLAALGLARSSGVPLR